MPNAPIEANYPLSAFVVPLEQLEPVAGGIPGHRNGSLEFMRYFMYMFQCFSIDRNCGGYSGRLCLSLVGSV